MIPRDLTPILKALKLRQQELSEEMGYSTVHISRVFCGRIKANGKFRKLLVVATAKKAKKDKAGKYTYKDFAAFLKGTDWERYLP